MRIKAWDSGYSDEGEVLTFFELGDMVVQLIGQSLHIKLPHDLSSSRHVLRFKEVHFAEQAVNNLANSLNFRHARVCDISHTQKQSLRGGREV